VVYGEALARGHHERTPKLLRMRRKEWVTVSYLGRIGLDAKLERISGNNTFDRTRAGALLEPLLPVRAVHQLGRCIHMVLLFCI